jgi:FtsH-binding integral membrane protein
VGQQPGFGAQPTTQVSVQAQGSFLTHAFVWMFTGLLVTAGVAFAVQGSDALLNFAAQFGLILLLALLALPMVIQLGINRLNATLALGLFFVYAAALGLVMGLIVPAYTAGPNGSASVVEAFLTSAGMFGGAALYGATTKRSLAGMGGILVMGLIGLIVAMVVNLFLANSVLDFILSIIGVVLFTALTAWDVQRISVGQLVQMTGSVEKAAVLGALRLYLDFVNLFLFLLRLFGGSRR